MASTKMKIRVRKKSSSTPVLKTISKEASPGSKCPICLDQFRNISYVDKCLHRFCFRCIHEWSKNKAECPLCKQPFSSIYHSIKAEDDFKEFHLRPTDDGSFGNLAGQRFRYRTTLTADRRAPARRTSPPPDHGVMFEGLGGAAGRERDRGFERAWARLGAWQGAEGRPLRTPREQDMIRFRRSLYRRGLWVRGVRDGGRSRETSAEFFRRNPACLHRLMPWIKRELTVLYGTHGSLVNIVQHIVMSQITRYDMRDAAVLQELRPFLLSRTEHFLHEFLSFARSPFNVEAYDRHAVYDCPAPSAEDSGSSDASVIALSEDDEADAPGTASPAVPLSHAAWDDETPGPSYTGEPPRTLAPPAGRSDAEEAGPSAAPPARTDAHQDEEDEGSDGEEDCVIVGYVKPTAERTPELVRLSSDSEESVQEEAAEPRVLPQHIRFTSEPSSPASDGSGPRWLPQEEAARRRRSSPLTPSAARASPSEHERRRSSPKDRRREVEGKQRCHSKKAQKERSRSRNRDREQSSHRQRGRSCSWSPCCRERSRATEASSSSLSCRPPHALHGPERRSSRYRVEKHPSCVSPGGLHSRAASWSHSWSYCHTRSRSRSRGRSRSRSRGRSRSRSRSPARSRSRSRSWSRSPARSINKSRSRGAHDWDGRQSESRRRNSSPSSRRGSRHKPSGKRKCKSLHTEQTSTQGERTSREERHKKWRRRRSRRRSPSVEIIYEGGAKEQSSRRHRRKKKRKRSKRRKRSTERRKRSAERRGDVSPEVFIVPSDTDGDEEAAAVDLSPVSHARVTDPAHPPPHSGARAQTPPTRPAVPADAPQLTGAASRNAPPEPPGGAPQPDDQQALKGDVHGSAEEPHGDFSSLK